jgi:aldose 1-epimerase
MNTEQKAYEGTYQGEPAVWLKAGPYEVAVLPGVGGNLIAFRDTEKGYKILREPAPEEMNEFKNRPIVHGIPVLFPPNRYEDGQFPWDGKVYNFPINEEKTNNHLHGFLHNIPWTVEEYNTSDSESWVTLSVSITEDHPVYQYFPHVFTFKLRYTLSSLGLQQHVVIKNDGQERMPCLLAFHTAINAPFDPGSKASDCTFKMTTGQRYELDDRMLPTGKFQTLTPQEEQMKAGGLSPYFEEMDNHYTAEPQNGRNLMELTDNRDGKVLIYDVGTSYKHWMIWNNFKTEGFFCPEPQINLVNAPKVDLPAEDIGLFALEPGEIWEETSRIYIK